MSELEKQLSEIRRHILSMGANVEQRVGRALEAMEHQNVELAREVRKSDIEINEAEVDIEHECLQVLALTHPVASDLRFIMTVLRINSDLERVGDKAKAIAKRVISLDRYGDLHFPPQMLEMASAAKRMLSDALSALADNNPELAVLVRRADDRVDQLQKEVFSWAHHEIRRSVDQTEVVINLLSIARALERIGDLATNIAEDIIFLVGGQVVRHREI